MSSAIVLSSQRYNWMGHNGTETKDVDTSLLRLDPKSRGSNYDYDHRQEVMADIKERLYLIKRDLDLIPEEELRAEEEARQRRRDARKQREEDARLAREEAARRRAEDDERRREEEAARQEEEARRAEEERVRREAEEEEARRTASKWRGLKDSDEDSDDEDARSALLAAMPRTQAEIDAATKTFTESTRVLLASKDAGHVSYLDGSSHSTLSALDAYNSKNTARVTKTAGKTTTAMPEASAFATAELHTTLDASNAARTKLDARRVETDPTYIARIRKAERRSLPALSEDDGDLDALSYQYDSARALHADTRRAYNERATASGALLATAAASRVPEGGAGLSESEPEAEVEEQQHQDREATAPTPEENSDEYPTEEPAAAAAAEEEAAPASASHKSSSPKASENADDEYPTEEPQEEEEEEAAAERAASSSKKSSSPKASEHESEEKEEAVAVDRSASASHKSSSPKASEEAAAGDEYPTEEPPAVQSASSRHSEDEL